MRQPVQLGVLRIQAHLLDISDLEIPYDDLINRYTQVLTDPSAEPQQTEYVGGVAAWWLEYDASMETKV
jgi:hypothetical protein